MTTTLSFSIVGYTINIVFSPTDWEEKKILLHTSITKYFGAFIIPSQENCDALIVVNEIRGIPFIVTKGKAYSQCFKRIRKNKYETYYHVSIFELSQLFLILLINLLGTSGFLLHASSVKTKLGAILFTGESGAGKSTAIQMLSKYYSPFTDDCIAIRKIGKKYVCYQVPWIEKSNVKIVKNVQPIDISQIYVVKKNSTFNIAKINTTQLLYEITKNVWIINNLSKTAIVAISKCVNFGVKGSILFFSLKSSTDIHKVISKIS
jgi:hypothetical protein